VALPNVLVDEIHNGKVVLFLGAGASHGAYHPKGIDIPTSKLLAEKLASRFLGAEYRDRPLAQVAELAISETDLFSVQDFIASEFKDFYPSDFHKLIPLFVWSGIATTNYDLILERAYEAQPGKQQNLVVFKKDGERVEDKLRTPNSLMFLKLHGCITEINNLDLPLILTTDQYISHRKNRTRLFDKLKSLSYEYPFLFVGHSLGDPDIRAILLELITLGDARPRSYITTPSLTQVDVRFWESRKITHIQASFKDFISDLNIAIPISFRKLTTLKEQSSHPISVRFRDPKSTQSESLASFIGRSIEYIHTGFQTTSADPQAFYKGYFVDWSPIAYNLDVPRQITDEIISEVFLVDEENRGTICDLYVIKGHAGSGKSVLLKRLAWDVATQFNKLCIFLKQGSLFDYEPLSELYRLCKERIFLFIDPANEYAELIEAIISSAKKDRVPITIITAERYNEWNARCEQLEPLQTESYDIKYLTSREIESLINLLTTHKSLGYLNGKPKSEQIEALSRRAGRQLLVALHEATLGKPFTDIVQDEYYSISSSRARSLYLTVCILHRLGIPIRAGLISRVHGISFSNFREDFFKPLEFIVFAKMNTLINDYVYQSRHPHIAEIVIERVLASMQDRYDEYNRIISLLDTDFSSDREALKGIMNAKELISLFRDPDMIRQLFNTAKRRYENDPMLLQQEAIFEMQSPGGSLEKATSLLSKAYSIAPYNKAIAHSLSELAFKKSENATNEIEQRILRKEAKKIAKDLISKGSHTAHPFHTIIKIELAELNDLIAEGSAIEIEKKSKEIGESIARGIQLFPDDSHIRLAEASFCDLINKHDQAFKALEKAFNINKRSPYIALRLAKVHEANGKVDTAIRILQDCVDSNPSDKSANYQLARLLMDLPDDHSAEIRYHLKRAFTIGDSNYAAQYWYARALYIDGQFKEAKEIFGTLNEANIDTKVKKEPRGIVLEKKIPKRFLGTISTVEASYAFIVRDQYQDWIFTHFLYNNKFDWKKLKSQKRISFELAFNYRGPVALNILEE
jgi:tetratricopeptide (TPR) repeat protein